MIRGKNFKKLKISSVCIMLSFGLMAMHFIAKLTMYRFFYFYTTGAFLFIIFLSVYSDYGRKIIHITLRSKLLIVMFLWFFLSASWSVFPALTQFEAMSLGIYLIVYFIFCYTCLNCSSEDVRKLYKLFVLIMIIINMIVIIKFGTIRPESAKTTSFLLENNVLTANTTGKEVKDAIGSYCNGMVGILGALLPFVIYCAYFERRRKKLLSVLLLILTLISLIAAQSRAAYAIIIFSFFTTGLFYTKNILAKLKRLIFGIFLLCVVIIGLYSIPVTKRYVSVVMHRFQVPDKIAANGTGSRAYSLLSSRIDMYEQGLKVIKEHPFLGFGMGAFKPEMERKYGRGQHIMHNVLLNLWTGGGIVPVFIFLFVFLKAFRNLWKYYKILLPYDKKEAYWYLCNFIVLCILFLHGQIRPQLSNTFMYFPLAIGLMSNYKKKVLLKDK